MLALKRNYEIKELIFQFAFNNLEYTKCRFQFMNNRNALLFDMEFN